MVWGKAGSTTLATSGDDLDITSMTASKFNQVMSNVLLDSTTVYGYFTFNSDTSSVYASRNSANGGAETTATSGANSSTIWQTLDTAGEEAFTVMYTADIVGQEKLSMFFNVDNDSGVGGAAPNRRESVFKYVPSPDATITSVELNNAGTGDYAISTNISVLGSDITPAATIPFPSNVQLGSRAEITDTRKIYHFTEPSAATYEDDFSTDNWTDTSFTGVSGGVLTGDLNRSGTNHGAVLDLGTPLSDDSWLMQFKLVINTVATGENNSVVLWLSDSQVVGINNNKDALGLGLKQYDNTFRLLAPDGTYSFYNTAGIGTPSTGTYYIEVIRDSSTSATLNIYPDATYSTPTWTTGSHTIAAGITNLQYAVVQGMNDGGSGGTWNISIDDLEIYDGVTAIPTDNTWEEEGT
jgi:hypothetical protein